MFQKYDIYIFVAVLYVFDVMLVTVCNVLWFPTC